MILQKVLKRVSFVSLLEPQGDKPKIRKMALKQQITLKINNNFLFGAILPKQNLKQNRSKL